MAKKITVAMLKDKDFSLNKVGEIPEIVNEGVKKVDKILNNRKEFEKFASEFNEDDEGIFLALGLVTMYFIKSMCTPAAWKYFWKLYKEEEVMDITV